MACEGTLWEPSAAQDFQCPAAGLSGLVRGGRAQAAVLVVCRGQLALLFTAPACDEARLELGGDERRSLGARARREIMRSGGQVGH
jgi:hypothetical protein